MKKQNRLKRKIPAHLCVSFFLPKLIFLQIGDIIYLQITNHVHIKKVLKSNPSYKKKQHAVYNGNVQGDGLTSSDLYSVPIHDPKFYTPGFSADMSFKKCLF